MSGKHTYERKLLSDIGVFRPAGVTVEDLLREMRSSNHTKASSSTSGARSTAPTQGELVTRLTSRVTELEKSDLSLRKSLAEREKEISSMRMRLKDTEMSASDELFRLRLENERLRTQTREMESFLADYGLVWVGYSAGIDSEVQDPDAAAATTMADEHAPEKGGPLPRSGTAGRCADEPGDAASKSAELAVVARLQEAGRLRAAIGDLNELAGDGKMRVVKEGGRARLEPVPRLLLIVFKNGFHFRGGPTRLFSSLAARTFVTDILDGYFPSELKDEFPDGVPIELVERLEENWVPGSTDPAGRSRTATIPETAVVRGGNVVSLLGGAAARSGRVGEAVVVEGQQDGGPASGASRTVLHIKAHQGFPPLLLKLSAAATVGSALELVRKHRPGVQVEELRTTYLPRRVFADRDGALTLEDAGLVPNATLVVASSR